MGAVVPASVAVGRPDYETVGDFYELLTTGLGELAGEMGEGNLFIAPADHQLQPGDIGAPELPVVTDLASATRALRLIVVQGEGAPGAGGSSHFDRFSAIRQEYLALAARRLSFRPSRNVTRRRRHGPDEAAAGISDALTLLPANGKDGVAAGVTFAMLRSTEGLVPGSTWRSCCRSASTASAASCRGWHWPPERSTRS